MEAQKRSKERREEDFKNVSGRRQEGSVISLLTRKKQAPARGSRTRSTWVGTSKEENGGGVWRETK